MIKKLITNIIYKGLIIVLLCLIFLSSNNIKAISETNGDCYWRHDKTFTRTSFDEDIKDILKSLARLNNNTSITFGENVKGSITIEFKNKPLKTTFEYIINRYHLDYFCESGTIHVFNPSSTTDLLVQLDNLPVEEAMDVLKDFGFTKKGIKIIPHDKTKTILLTGEPREIKNIQNILNVIESSRKKIQVGIKPEIRFFSLTYAKVDDTEINIGKKSVTVKGIVSILTEILNLTRIGEKKLVEINDNVSTRNNSPVKPFAKNKNVHEKVYKKMIESEEGTIASDSRLNLIIIRDYPDKLDEYGNLIRRLDKPLQMVNIDIIIVEASKGFAREFGVGYSGKKTHEETKTTDAYFGTSQNANEVFKETNDQQYFIKKTYDNENNVTNEEVDKIPMQLTVNKLIPLLGTAAGSQIDKFGLAGTFLYEGGHETLVTTLSATETKGKSRIIYKSSVLTMDNMKAIIENKNVVTYKLNSGGDNPTVESKEIDAGIKLEITPHIIHGVDAKIELVVETERSSLNRLNRTDDIPEKSMYNINTQAIVKNRQTVVLGGIFQNDYAISETGIPCLMNIPLLGYLFKTTGSRNPTQNILFFITPKIITELDDDKIAVEINGEIKNLENELREITPKKKEHIIEMMDYMTPDIP